MLTKHIIRFSNVIVGKNKVTEGAKIQGIHKRFHTNVTKGKSRFQASEVTFLKQAARGITKD